MHFMLVSDFLTANLQDDPFIFCQKEMAVALKRCIFDSMLVKPKCV